MSAWYTCGGRLTEDNVNAFFARFQFLFNFATEKFVIIRDWRLGLILRLLQIGIFIYVLYDIINQASYLQQEVPKGVISPLAPVTRVGRIESFDKQRDSFDDGGLRYCTDGSNYAYNYNGAAYNNFRCVVMDSLAVPVPGESKFFVTTYLRLDKLFYISAPDGVDCTTDMVEDIPDTATSVTKLYNVCLFNSVDQLFPISPEEIPLEILHSYYTSVVDKSGSLPETIISTPGYSNGGELKYRSGDNLNFTLQDLLDVAGVDLDKPLNDQPYKRDVSESAKGNDTEEFPMARLSGVNIIMNFKYYIRSLAPGGHRRSSGPHTDNVICIVELDPQYVWSSQGSDIQQQLSGPDDPFFVDPQNNSPYSDASLLSIQVDYQRNGVQLSFQVSGNMGKFSFFALMDALVSGAVLLSVAQLIVTYVALYALGLSSQLYMEFMRESVEWREEYARFAAQSLVAGAAFKNYDKNKSGTLDRTEIYRYLKDIFSREKSNGEDEETDDQQSLIHDDKIACLTDFLMRQGEQDTQVSKGRLDEERDVIVSTINIAEWIDIFTEEKVKVTSLIRLIDQEYKDPKIIKILLDAAEGRLGRGLSTAVSGQLALNFQRQQTEASESLLGGQGVSLTNKGV
eukprot:g1223.t1